MSETSRLVSTTTTPVYSRPGIICIPVVDLEPAQIAVASRRRDRRPAIRDFIRACRDAAAARARNRAGQHA
jgi:hypothetical protein